MNACGVSASGRLSRANSRLRLTGHPGPRNHPDTPGSGSPTAEHGPQDDHPVPGTAGSSRTGPYHRQRTARSPLQCDRPASRAAIRFTRARYSGAGLPAWQTAAMEAGLRVHEGGSGEPLLVLLHGLGATGDVWGCWWALLARRWRGRWLAPDLPGH